MVLLLYGYKVPNVADSYSVFIKISSAKFSALLKQELFHTSKSFLISFYTCCTEYYRNEIDE